MLDFAMAENIQYLETKRSVSARLYELDPDPKYMATNGKRYIDQTEGEYEIQQNIKFVNAYKKQNPEFIGLAQVANSYRRSSKSDIEKDIERVLKMHKKYPNYIVAYDMVAEEDRGNSYLFYLKEFIEMYKNAPRDNKVPLYLHTGETNWPDDLLTSPNPDDPVSTLENTYEAVLLGARRVGHGLGYFKHPYLLQYLKHRRTAVEICPASNQLLGYVPDLRNHPAVNYIRSGVPVVLSSDDPSTFGYDSFSVDWYEAFMGWGINLADMKQLAFNSLNYSSMGDNEKTTAINNKWLPAWNRFIAEMKKKACSPSFVPNSNGAQPVFGYVFPPEGPTNTATTVHVFGRNFESAICKRVLCKFGNVITEGRYVSNTQIQCQSASPIERQYKGTENVNISISFTGEAPYLNTNSTFTYMHFKKVPDFGTIG